MMQMNAIDIIHEHPENPDVSAGLAREIAAWVKYKSKIPLERAPPETFDWIAKIGDKVYLIEAGKHPPKEIAGKLKDFLEKSGGCKNVNFKFYYQPQGGFSPSDYVTAINKVLRKYGCKEINENDTSTHTDSTLCSGGMACAFGINGYS